MSAKARFVCIGDTLDITAGADITAGDVVITSGVVGIAKDDISSGCKGAVALNGRYEVVKDANAITFGANVYWNATSSYATATSSGNTALGVCMGQADAGDATVIVQVG